MRERSAGILGACLLASALIIALVPRPAPGRYQLVERKENSGHPLVFLVDTQTGQVWTGMTKNGIQDYEWFALPPAQGAPTVNGRPFAEATPGGR
jgi:hypothetical protein